MINHTQNTPVMAGQIGRTRIYATFECGRLHVLVYSRTTGSVQNVSSFFLIHHSWVLKDKEEDARPTIYVFRSYDRQFSSAYQMLDARVLPAEFAFVASQSNSHHLFLVRSNCGLNEENAIRSTFIASFSFIIFRTSASKMPSRSAFCTIPCSSAQSRPL